MKAAVDEFNVYGSLAAHFKIALRSLSIWPFYGMMLLVIVITSILVR